MLSIFFASLPSSILDLGSDLCNNVLISCRRQGSPYLLPQRPSGIQCSLSQQLADLTLPFLFLHSSEVITLSIHLYHIIIIIICPHIFTVPLLPQDQIFHLPPAPCPNPLWVNVLVMVMLLEANWIFSLHHFGTSSFSLVPLKAKSERNVLCNLMEQWLNDRWVSLF